MWDSTFVYVEITEIWMGEWDSDSGSRTPTKGEEMTRRSADDYSFEERWVMGSDGMSSKWAEIFGGRWRFSWKKQLEARKTPTLFSVFNLYSYNSLKCSEIFEQICLILRKEKQFTHGFLIVAMFVCVCPIPILQICCEWTRICNKWKQEQAHCLC